LHDGSRNLLQSLRDTVAVRRFEGENLENQHVERALRDGKSGGRHGYPKLLPFRIEQDRSKVKVSWPIGSALSPNVYQNQVKLTYNGLTDPSRRGVKGRSRRSWIVGERVGSGVAHTANRIGAIVKGQRGITADTALRLARYSLGLLNSTVRKMLLWPRYGKSAALRSPEFRFDAVWSRWKQD
jgi:hypothetical protein